MRVKEMMKKNKIASIMLTGILAAAMAVPAFAADITIDGTGSEFQAYRLLDLTTSNKTCEETHEHTAACQYNYSYTVPEKYAAALKAVTGKETEAEVIDYLEKMTADETRAFANAVYAQVKTLGADETTTGKTISGAEQGYYLIVESQKGADPDTVSLVMLDTAGQDNITVTTKEGVPTLTKKIVEGDKDVDAADYAVGDTVSFKLTGTMPDNIDGYAKYKYIMHDSLSKGLEFKADSVVVTIDGSTIDKANYQVKTEGLHEGCSFEVIFDDLKACGKTITKNTKVIVTYDAELTAAADIGNPGNPNTARLEFSSDPNTGGEGETAKTPEDKVAAFTFELVVNKIDKDKQPLAGAEFELQVLDKDGQKIKAIPVEMNDTGTAFTFTGLDSGKYKLVETKVPAGYNKADDVEFEIVSTMTEEAADPSLTNLVIMQNEEVVSSGEDAKFSVVIDAGQATTAVVNTTGIRLPSTGGMGTYVIYGGGAALVAGGIALAVIKKKKDSGAEA